MNDRSLRALLAPVLAGSLLAQSVSADLLPNAWQITDNTSTVGDPFPTYRSNLPPALINETMTHGFRLTVNGRFLDNLGGTKSMAFGFKGVGGGWNVWCYLNGSGALIAELSQWPGPPFTLTPLGLGTAQYHTYEIVGSTNPPFAASFWVDGTLIASNWIPSGTVPGSPGDVNWGADSMLGGKGRMNFHSVSFSVTNGVVASYDAGTQGNPGTAPDPTTLGWTLSDGVETTVTNVSPDTALLPVAVTQPADQFMPDGARLNGQVDASGSPTTAWFEWGADTNYAMATAPQAVGSGLNPLNYSFVLGGLERGPEYHYRLVVSNAFGVIVGTDQSFTVTAFLLVNVPGLSGVADSSVAWGDYDGDGRLDFLLTGLSLTGRVSQLWHNTGVGFTNVPISGLPGVGGAAGGSSSECSLAWGDFDGDGRLDFLITGTTNGNASGVIAQIWRNTGVGFSNVTSAIAPGLPGVYDSSVAWGDFDDDGRLDFLLNGDSSTGEVSQLWRNTGSGFVNVPAPDLPEVGSSSVAWGDYDNDGRLDFMITGTTNGSSGGAISQLWRNTGSGFTNVTGIIASVPARVHNSSVAWGDYDNDGRLDFVLAGLSSSGARVSQLWHNTGNGFSHLPIPNLPGAGGSSVIWGDFDNDGRLDFLLAGTSNGAPGGVLAQWWRNTGSTFTNALIPELPGVRDGSIACGDYDNDGRLDILITGLDSSDTPVSQLWRNNLPVSNAPPAAPVGLSATVSVTTISLNWTPPSDDHTPGAGLNYNVRIGTVPGGSNVLSPMSLANGRRLLPALGNAQAATSVLYDLSRLPRGQKCYWSVQALDTGFAGSPFAVEQQFVVDPLTAEIEATSAIFGSPPWTIQFIGHASSGVAGLDTTDDQSGTITARGQNLPNEGAAKAFDNNVDTKWLDFATDNPSTRASWIQYQYAGGKANTVRQYTITSANDTPERDPRDWKILGSNDGGTSWVTLDIRTNQTFSERFLKKSYEFINNTAFNIYRLTNDSVLNPITANSVQLAELEFPGSYAYQWAFGDGATSSNQNPQHTYPSNGIYTVTLIVSDGVSTATNTLSVNTADPQFNVGPRLQQPVRLGNGVFQFAFSNLGAATFEVRATTNLALPVTSWDNLGLPIPLGGGLYQFNDGLAPNYPQRFYRLREP